MTTNGLTYLGNLIGGLHYLGSCSRPECRRQFMSTWGRRARTDKGIICEHCYRKDGK